MVIKNWLALLVFSFWILAACHLVARSPAPSPTTAFPSPSPSTPILPTPTASSPAVLTKHLENVRIVSIDTFDDPSRWIPTNEISNGELLLVGIGGNVWYGLSNRAVFREGSGAVINFQFTPGNSFEVYFEHGPWDTNQYKRFGVYVNSDHSNINIFMGKVRRNPGLIAGNLPLTPGAWYSLLLAVGRGGDFLAVIWNPTHPEQSLQYREMIPNWAELGWTFRIQANLGTIMFDDFEQTEFDAIK